MLEYYGPDKIDPYEVDNFTRAYIECALWSSLDWDNQEHGNPVQMDRDHSIEDISHSTLSAMVFICRTWQDAMSEAIEAFEDDHQSDARYSQSGHSLWLTQNEHGAGFEDFKGDAAKTLYKAAKIVKPIDLYVGDDERIHA